MLGFLLFLFCVAFCISFALRFFFLRSGWGWPTRLFMRFVEHCVSGAWWGVRGAWRRVGRRVACHAYSRLRFRFRALRFLSLASPPCGALFYFIPFSFCFIFHLSLLRSIISFSLYLLSLFFSFSFFSQNSARAGLLLFPILFYSILL